MDTNCYDILKDVKIVFSYDNNFNNKIVSLFTNFKYSHVDIWFKDINLAAGSIPGKGTGIRSDDVIFNSDEVLICDILVPKDINQDILVNTLFNICKKYSGLNYDWFSIYTFFIRRFFRPSSDKYICSEYIIKVFKEAGIPLLSTSINEFKLDGNKLLINYDSISPKEVFLSPFIIPTSSTK